MIIIFIYDYRRNRIFTNEKPEMFVLKGEKPKEEPSDKKDTEETKKPEEPKKPEE